MLGTLRRLGPRAAIVRGNTAVMRQIRITPLINCGSQSHYSRVHGSVGYNTTISNDDSRRCKILVNIQGFNDISKNENYTLKYIMYLLPYSLTLSLTHSLTYSLTYSFTR